MSITMHRNSLEKRIIFLLKDNKDLNGETYGISGIESPAITKDTSFSQIDYRVSHCSSNQNSNRIFHET